jgi:hypothetical protein
VGAGICCGWHGHRAHSASGKPHKQAARTGPSNHGDQARRQVREYNADLGGGNHTIRSLTFEANVNPTTEISLNDGGAKAREITCQSDSGTTTIILKSGAEAAITMGIGSVVLFMAHDLGQ